MTKEDKAKQAAIERANNMCEVCGKGSQLNVHHIEGRKKARKKTGNWPDEVAEDYPHCLLNLIVLCVGGHRWAEDAKKHSRPLLWAWLNHLYGGHDYKGKAVSEWMAGPGPWEEYL